MAKKTPFKFYLHNGYQMNEIRELIADKETGLSEEAQEQLAEEIYNRFYEIAFAVEFDNNGKITKVTPTDR